MVWACDRLELNSRLEGIRVGSKLLGVGLGFDYFTLPRVSGIAVSGSGRLITNRRVEAFGFYAHLRRPRGLRYVVWYHSRFSRAISACEAL